ncbi:MAG: hypothetical protein ACOC93_06145 [Planctomycetota bacterium]
MYARWTYSALVTLLAAGVACGGVEIEFDYSLDTNGFFALQQRRAVMEHAADTLLRFTDPLDPIDPGGDDTWEAFFLHPGTGADWSVFDAQIPVDTIRIYAGGRDLPTGVLGLTSTGVSVDGQSEWVDTVVSRGQSGALDSPPTDHGPWGASLSFDTGQNWHLGIADQPPSGQPDLLSVAIHELSHALGFGLSDSWMTYTSDSTFTGPNARKVFGGSVPLADRGHWAETVEGMVGDERQSAAMTASIGFGDRKRFTDVDVAGLLDVGWTRAPLGDADRDGVVGLDDLAALSANWDTLGTGAWKTGDFTGEGDVNQADLDLLTGNWPGAASARLTSIPEPATLLTLTCLLPVALRRRR